MVGNLPSTPSTAPTPITPVSSPPPASPSPVKPSFAEDPVTRPPQPPAGSSEKKAKKMPASPVVAGIAVLLLLITGLGTGIYLLGQPRIGEIRRQAEEFCAICNHDNAGDSCECDSSGKQTGNKCKPAPASCANLGYTWQQDIGCTSGAACSSGPTPGGGLTGACPPDPVVWCATFNCPNGDTDGDGTCNPSPHGSYAGDQGASYVTQWGNACPQPASGCGQVDKYNKGEPDKDWGAYCGHSFIKLDCVAGPTSTPAPTATPIPTGAPTATPRPTRVPTITPEPTINLPGPNPTEVLSARCRQIIAQVKDETGTWKNVPQNDFATVAKPGENVRFVARGEGGGGQFLAAAFFINGVLHKNDVVQIAPTRFAVEYTIPASGGVLEVGAVLLDPQKGWVD